MDGELTAPEVGQTVRARDFGGYEGEVTSVLVRDGVRDTEELGRASSLLADVGCRDVVRVRVTEPADSHWQAGQVVDIDVRRADLVPVDRAARPVSRTRRA